MVEDEEPKISAWDGSDADSGGRAAISASQLQDIFTASIILRKPTLNHSTIYIIQVESELKSLCTFFIFFICN